MLLDARAEQLILLRNITSFKDGMSLNTVVASAVLSSKGTRIGARNHLGTP